MNSAIVLATCVVRCPSEEDFHACNRAGPDPATARMLAFALNPHLPPTTAHGFHTDSEFEKRAAMDAVQAEGPCGRGREDSEHAEELSCI